MYVHDLYVEINASPAAALQPVASFVVVTNTTVIKFVFLCLRLYLQAVE
jgi:hypothetical protein